jgi:hypothetical protein
MIDKELAREAVKAMEAGFYKHLNRSFIYSPFKLFFNLFKKSNQGTIAHAKEVIRQDVQKILQQIDNFEESKFIDDDDKITPIGKKFLQKCYNIGINILKKDLTIGLAFKAIRDHNLRGQIYDNILHSVQNVAERLLYKEIGSKPREVN